MTITKQVGIGLIAVGAGLAALGLQFGGPFVGLSLAVFGAAAIGGGLHSVVTRQHQTDSLESTIRSRQHSGASAVIFGFTFMLVGVVLIVAGLASVIGSSDGLWSWVADNAGLVAMAGGAWVCLVGVATVISRWTHLHASTVWWQRLPGMAVGVLVVAIGVVTIAVGRSLAVDPPEDVLESVADTLARWLGGG